MKYAVYIIIFILATAAGWLAFRSFVGPGDLASDFNLTGDIISSDPRDSIDSGSVASQDGSGDSPTSSQGDPVESDEESSDHGASEVMITDGIQHIVPLDKILSGGPPKDGIPSIDDPKFISVTQADELLDDDKLGIAVEKDDAWRFYPFQILVWHEIVNDVFKGENILITYCPLCGTGIVFTPLVDGEFVEFGTSGRLFNSNLVMYDRKSDSLWSQQGGRAIVGVSVGQALEVRPADNVTWAEFKAAHPDAEVLSTDTGNSRDYTRDPYSGYYTNRDIYFPVENRDGRLHEKAIVYGLSDNGQTKAYSEEAIKRDQIINDTFSGIEILVIVEPKSQAVRFFRRSINDQVLTFELSNGKIVDRETGSEWDFNGIGIAGAMIGKQLERISPEFGFWFSWVAFNPETELYD